ncbi:MAG: YgaP-like transmembrane domain [Erysipelotrichaceae bacterium]
MKNVGNKDAMIRYILAVILVVIGLVLGATSVTSIVLYVVAAVLAVTAQIKICPIYKILKIDTLKFK